LKCQVTVISSTVTAFVDKRQYRSYLDRTLWIFRAIATHTTSSMLELPTIPRCTGAQIYACHSTWGEEAGEATDRIAVLIS
jgi:hypothetical protein